MSFLFKKRGQLGERNAIGVVLQYLDDGFLDAVQLLLVLVGIWLYLERTLRGIYRLNALLRLTVLSLVGFWLGILLLLVIRVLLISIFGWGVIVRILFIKLFLTIVIIFIGLLIASIVLVLQLSVNETLAFISQVVLQVAVSPLVQFLQMTRGGEESLVIGEHRLVYSVLYVLHQLT